MEKSKIKRSIIVFFVCLLLSPTGCNKTPDIVRTIKSPISIEEFSIIKFYNENEVYSKEMKWEEYIKEKFSISIDLHCLHYDENLFKIIPDSGIVYFENLIQLNEFIDRGLLIELNKYGIETIFNQYELNLYSKNSNIYGIPVSNFYEYYSRFYINSKTENITVKNIDSIDSFYEVMKKLCNSDIDEKKVTAIGLNIKYAHRQLYDISRAFGCYFGTQNQIIGNALTYNPNTNSFEDCVFSDNIFDYINYLELMKEQGILELDEIIWHKYDEGYPYITFWASVVSNINNEKFTIGSNYLIGNNTNNLYEINNYINSFGILKNTSNIESSIKLITDKPNSDNEFYLSLSWGIQDVDFQIHENYFVNYDLDNEAVGINSLNNTPMCFSKNVKLEVDEIIEMREKAIQRNFSYDAYIEKLNHEIIFSLPYEYCEEFLLNKSFYNREGPIDFNQIVLRQVLENEVSTNDAINEYKKIFYKRNMKDEIYILNTNISSETKNSY